MTGSEMSGPRHYREAERLLDAVEKIPDQYGEAAAFWTAHQQLATAQVHATLALVAATAYPPLRDYGRDPDPLGWGHEDQGIVNYFTDGGTS